MPDATYVGAGMPCGNCGNPLTPGQPHKCGRVENPYAPSSDWKPGQDTFTAQAAGIWDEGFAAGRAAFDAVVAERDRQFTAIRAEWDVLIAERDAAITAGQKLAEALRPFLVNAAYDCRGRVGSHFCDEASPCHVCRAVMTLDTFDADSVSDCSSPPSP